MVRPPSRALVWLSVACLMAGCPEEATDVDAGDLPPGVEPGLEDGGLSYGFCPTRIDVYGGASATFAGCGGADVPAGAEPEGLSGDAGYPATLAGRLQARLAADPVLSARFGAAWQVRSCARATATMGTFSRAIPPGECSAGGATGGTSAFCTASPAPLVLYAGSNAVDRCHGGGSDSPAPEDDPAGYADHWRFRLTDFLSSRTDAGFSGFSLVSPQPEWHGQPGGASDAGTCGWARPDWNADGALTWRARNRAVRSVRLVSHLHDTFKRHHPCCAALGAACEEDWFRPDAGGDGWVQFGCPGAAALEDFWFAEVKAFLLNNRFSCGG